MTKEKVLPVEVTNIGPVHHFRFLVPAEGGLVILKGRNGAGKTRTLRAIESLSSGRGSVDHSDGVDRGEVEAFGATLRVGRQTRRSGELEVLGLEGRFSVFDLINPGIQDPLAADNKRIKALVQLSGMEADPSVFYPLVGGKTKFSKMISLAAVDTPDLVTMASRIKRELEEKARLIEKEAEKEKLAGQSERSAAEGIDLTAPHDQEELSAALEAAVRAHEALKTRETTAIEADEKATEARRSLRTAQGNYKGLSFAEAQEQVRASLSARQGIEKEVSDLVERLQEARSRLATAKAQEEAAGKAEETAYEHERLMAQWKADVEAASKVDPVEPETLQAAEKAVQEARDAVELGALVRDRLSRIEKAQAHLEEAKTLRKEAEKLRDAAKGTDDVLSQAVSKFGGKLRVAHGRLVTDTDRGEEHFAELSDGEQCDLAFEVAIDAIATAAEEKGEAGLLTIDQRDFQGLDPEHRILLAQRLREKGVIGLTAEATGDEELTSEIFKA